VVLFTSGSEGKPKGVVLSHRAILANIAQIRAVIDFSVDDKVLNACRSSIPSVSPPARCCRHAVRRQPVSLPVAAALPGDSGTGLRPQLHRALRHLDLPRPTTPASPTPMISTACAMSSPAPKSCPTAVRGTVVRKIRHPHFRRLRRHRNRAGAGGEHPDGLQDRHRRQPAAGYRGASWLPVPGIERRHPACARPQRDERLSQGRPTGRAATAVLPKSGRGLVRAPATSSRSTPKALSGSVGRSSASPRSPARCVSLEVVEKLALAASRRAHGSCGDQPARRGQGRGPGAVHHRPRDFSRELQLSAKARETRRPGTGRAAQNPVGGSPAAAWAQARSTT
jgi:hypothetical protein